MLLYSGILHGFKTDGIDPATGENIIVDTDDPEFCGFTTLVLREILFFMICYYSKGNDRNNLLFF